MASKLDKLFDLTYPITAMFKGQPAYMYMFMSITPIVQHIKTSNLKKIALIYSEVCEHFTPGMFDI